MNEPLFRWCFRANNSAVVIHADSFFLAREYATRVLGCGLDELSFSESPNRDADVEVRMEGHDAGRVPQRHREVRTRGEDGEWTDWRSE
jgi:hypothetical protein